MAHSAANIPGIGRLRAFSGPWILWHDCHCHPGRDRPGARLVRNGNLILTFFFCFAAKQKKKITISYMHFIIGQEIPQYIKDYLRSLELNVTWARPTAYGIAVEIRRAQVRTGYFFPPSNTAQ